MAIIYIIIILIIIVTIANYIKKTNESNSPYIKIKKKLDEELLQADFLGDWKRSQEIKLQLIWLKTIREVEINDLYGQKKNLNTEAILSSLSIDDIRFPRTWNLNDFYCFPFSQEIISAYGKVLAENDYEGFFKPDSILPVPKIFIRKAILFTFDYLNLKNPIYLIEDKDKRAETLNTVNSFLENSFIDTGNEKLPKSLTENYKIGSTIKNNLSVHNDVEDLELIDWRSETDWIVRGIHYADNEDYAFAFACFHHAQKINPESKEANFGISTLLLYKGEQHFENGEIELAFENINKAAKLENKEAIKWLEEHTRTI